MTSEHLANALSQRCCCFCIHGTLTGDSDINARMSYACNAGRLGMIHPYDVCHQLMYDVDDAAYHAQCAHDINAGTLTRRIMLLYWERRHAFK